MDFVGACGEQLVNHRLLARTGPKKSADALDVLAFATAAADDDRHRGVWNVDPLVEYFR